MPVHRPPEDSTLLMTTDLRAPLSATCNFFTDQTRKNEKQVINNRLSAGPPENVASLRKIRCI